MPFIKEIIEETFKQSVEEIKDQGNIFTEETKREDNVFNLLSQIIVPQQQQLN